MITEDGRLVCDDCSDEFPEGKQRKGGIILTDRTGPKTVVWQFCDEMCFAQWLDNPASRELIWPGM